ncbi:GNAT family N-acetyltransferase [Nocardioides nanhaiensis]|uniref:GNAT family N-acetyltransferase n=1 Tax=Nocardioides nanhaiensis TaxID=1476871 RepID=UPI0031EBD3E1
MPDPDVPLPPGHRARPLTVHDLPAVTALVAAQERHDLGHVLVEEADLAADWSRPSFDPSLRTIGVEPLAAPGTLVAYGELGHAERGDLAVHPDHRGSGLGTWLAGWLERTARAGGASVVGTPVPAGSPADRLLEHLGWHVRWRSWVLALPAHAQVPARTLPPGHAVRAARDDELAACWQVVEDAFLEWSRRERQPLEDWAAGVVGRPGFEPWHLRVATDQDDQVVGVAVLTVGGDDGRTVFVAQLAVRAEHRGRGLAQALLADAFAEGRRHGHDRAELSTDSRTGALGLYERLGMVVTSDWVHRAVRIPT